MSLRVAIVAVTLSTVSACTLIRDVLASDLSPNVFSNVLFIATAAACIIWYGASRAAQVTASVQSAEHEIRTDVVLTAISGRRSVRD